MRFFRSFPATFGQHLVSRAVLAVLLRFAMFGYDLGVLTKIIVFMSVWSEVSTRIRMF